MASGHVKNRRSQCYKDEDLQEEDVWGSMEASKPISSSTRNLACTPRNEVSKRASAPVKIPSRQMMMVVNGNGNESSWVVHDDGHDDDGVYDDNDDDDDDDDDDEVVPPHEYISRRLARTKSLSFSVSEGVGRKLKGRDLSEVRNGVLRKTGFLE